MKAQPSIARSSVPSREELALYMPLVHGVVGRMLRRLPRTVQRDDLVAAGMTGLLHALRKSPERDAAFDWYARLRIRGAVVDELRAQDWLPRGARARQTKAMALGGRPAMSMISIDAVVEDEVSGLLDHETPNPEQLLELRTSRAALARETSLLPERLASVMTLHYFEDVPFRDIAARLGVTPGRVSQLHRQAMGLLRARIHQPEPAAA